MLQGCWPECPEEILGMSRKCPWKVLGRSCEDSSPKERPISLFLSLSLRFSRGSDRHAGDTRERTKNLGIFRRDRMRKSRNLEGKDSRDENTTTIDEHRRNVFRVRSRGSGGSGGDDDDGDGGDRQRWRGSGADHGTQHHMSRKDELRARTPRSTGRREACGNAAREKSDGRSPIGSAMNRGAEFIAR